jgi:hypothetical protein
MILAEISQPLPTQVIVTGIIILLPVGCILRTWIGGNRK